MQWYGENIFWDHNIRTEHHRSGWCPPISNYYNQSNPDSVDDKNNHVETNSDNDNHDEPKLPGDDTIMVYEDDAN